MSGAWLRNLVGPWGAPGDLVAWTSLAMGVALVGLALARKDRAVFFPDTPTRTWVFACALGAAFLSLGYVALYLRGGPRIIDATAYLSEARALAAGHFGAEVPLPSESFRGRFLLYDEQRHAITGIFPPGYPLLLSLGVRIGAPMVIGPLLAGALVYATAWLARELCERTTLDVATRREVVRVATAAEVLCAAMRYHTADTMSHGLAALLVTVALAAALAATRPSARATWLVALASLSVGWLAATRLASAPPLFVMVVAVLARGARRGRARLVLPFALGLAPGLALLLASQSAATGSLLTSAQKLYYARSDGPVGCFRYGFGADIGCTFEHGDFVRARLGDGYGVLAALGVTLRRLRAHLTDVQNLEPLALVPLLPLVVGRRTRRAALLGLSLLGLYVLGYAPFYFDGNYPGGGARFFADVLPTEHVLFALGAASLHEGLAARAKHVPYTRVAAALLGAGLVGFAVHASFDHRALADREGGTPMFERDALVAAGVTHGLVFVDTDHGFLLGSDPTAGGDAQHALVVARLRGDASDRVLFDALGAPPTYRYERGSAAVAPRLVPFVVPEARVSGLAGYRFESENEWPPLSAQRDPERSGFAIPAWASAGCASGGRVLRVVPGHAGEAHVTLALPLPEARAYWLSARVHGRGTRGQMTVRVTTSAASAPSLELVASDPAEGDCVDLPPQELPGPRGAGAGAGSGRAEVHEARVEVSVRGGGAGEAGAMDLDALTLRAE